MYLARDRLHDDEIVALKIYRQDIVAERVFTEFRTLRELRHPAFARSIDFGRIATTGRPYFTMEYVPGDDLAVVGETLRREGGETARRKLASLLLQLTRALGYLHRRGLLHLDVKPTNVVVNDDRAKLIDFGLVQATVSRQGAASRATAYFSAPEIFDGPSVDHRTDLYALGVTICQVWTGKYPIRGRSLAQIVESHRRAPPQLPPGLPDALAPVVRKLLAKSPTRRFQSADELVTALEELLPDGTRATTAVVFDEPDFVGRRRELDAFFSWIDRLQESTEAQALLIEGAPGIGKSRFLDACATELAGTGMDVLRIRGGMSGRSDLAELVNGVECLRPSAARLRRDLGFLEACVGGAASPEVARELADLDLQSIRSRATRELTELLRGALPGPLVIVMDDADNASAQLLNMLGRWFADPSRPDLQVCVGVLASCRDRDATPLPADSARVEAIELKPLKQRELLKSLDALRPSIGQRVLTNLVRSSGGHPAYLVHSIRQVLAGDDCPRAPSAGGLRSLLDEQVTALGRDALKAAVTLSLATRPFDENLVSVATGLRGAEGRAAVLELRKSGLAGQLSTGLVITPPLAGELVLERAEAADLRSTHQRIGQHLAELPNRRAESAYHLLRGDHPTSGLEAATKTAREHLSRGRFEEAEELLEEAVKHADSSADRAEILATLGDLQTKSGRFDDSRRSFEALLDLCDHSPSARASVLRSLGGVHQRSGDNESARRAFESALQLVDQDTDLAEQLHLYNELASFHLFRMEVAQATTFANRGIELLRSDEARELPTESRALHAMNLHSIAGQTLLRQFEYRLASEQLARSLEFAREVGDVASSALILNNLGVAYHQSNELGKALGVYKKAARLAASRGDATARFSILCNTAAIRARRGELNAARNLLEEVESLPHSSASKRARLFYLHSRGLVDRLTLVDARALWSESIEIAESLPDPLFASYGRLYLLENEITLGRWAAARDMAEEIRSRGPLDARFEQALDCREALLEALVGDDGRARSLIDRSLPPESALREGTRAPDYGELWNWILAATGLIEVDQLDRAAAWLGRARKELSRTRQRPGVVECVILLCEISLRRGDLRRSGRLLREARRLLGLHDTSDGSRGARSRVPFLEARIEIARGNTTDTRVADRLADAAGNVSLSATAEISWLVDLVAVEQGRPGASVDVQSSRNRFLAGLREPDRQRYLNRDHRRRLGIAREQRSEDTSRPSTDPSARYLESLVAIRDATSLADALGVLRSTAIARRAFLFRDGDPDLVVSPSDAASTPFPADRRAEILRTAWCEPRDGVCSPVVDSDGRRRGVVFLESPTGAPLPAAREFLDLAGLLLGRLEPPKSGRIDHDLAATTRTITTEHETQPLSSSGDFVAVCANMRELLALAERTSDSELPVLLTGESGTGKDHLARWIHQHGRRRDGPFLGFDCSAVPEGLLEAELFGHEAGAFTDANTARTGCLVAARGGTLYLDNVDSLDLEVQVKLLRALERDEVRPLGSTKTTRLDLRFIASSQRDLNELCVKHEFRGDLYFRLAGIDLRIPPLREHVTDIGPLISSFQRRANAGHVELSARAIKVLEGHPWPGNVRELESLIRRLALTVDGVVEESHALHALGLQRRTPSIPHWVFEGRDYDQILRDVKREYLLHLFDRVGGDIERMAAELRTTKRNVYHRLSRVGLKTDDLRSRGSVPRGT